MNVEAPTTSRRVLFAVSDRSYEAAAAWRWAARHFLEPLRDQLTFVHIHTGGIASLVRGGARAGARAAAQRSGAAAALSAPLAEAEAE